MATKPRDVMTADPTCCLPSDTTQHAARLMADQRVGSIPVVADQQSRRLQGIITDRDIATSVAAQGRDAASVKVADVMTRQVVSCRAGDDLAGCERLMRENQIRRVPVVDDQGRCVGMVSQADLALKMNEPERVHQTLAAISHPTPHASVPRAAA